MPRFLHDHKVNTLNTLHIEIEVTDSVTQGGAPSEYLVHLNQGQDPVRIKFQDAPLSEVGVNGLTQEVLLAITVDRLRAFQQGPFACRENALALTKLEEAQLWLHKRSLDRDRLGVEGTYGIREGVEAGHAPCAPSAK